MTAEQKKSEMRWWLRSIILPLGIVAVVIAWLGVRSSRPHIKTLPYVVLANAGFTRHAPLNAPADLRRPKSISISVEIHPIGIPEAVDFIHTFDEFSLAFDRNVVQKFVLQHGENQRTAHIELDTEGPHSYRVIANQHEEMGPGTNSPGNPGHSTFEGAGKIVLHNNAKYLIVVGKGTSYKDRVSIREIN
jgi:hypothetical protein